MLSTRNYFLLIINSSECVSRQSAIADSPTNPETIASQECKTADDYINSMIQSKITIIKTHSDPDYAPMPKPIRNDQ